MNHLPLFENVCILPLFLKDIFTWYRMLAWQIFPLSILTFFSPLSSSLYCVWGGVSSHLNHISLCSCHFFLWLPSIFSVSFPLSNCALLPHTRLQSSGCGCPGLCPLVLHGRETVGFFVCLFVFFCLFFIRVLLTVMKCLVWLYFRPC